MSKSGLYAHFGSKEELQLATIAAARERYLRTAVAPGLEAPKGLAQIERTMEYLLRYLENGTFPGGCFFNSVNAEFHGRPGAIRDNIREGKAGWRARVARMVKDAQRNGEMRGDVDPNDLRLRAGCVHKCRKLDLGRSTDHRADAPRHPCMHRARQIMSFTGQVADPRIGAREQIMIRIAGSIS